MAPPTESFSPESWEYARGYAGVFGVVPSSFTSVIRSLMAEHSAGLAQTQGNNKYFVLRLLKSPSLIAPFYFATEVYNPDTLVQNGQTPPDQLIKGFTPFEVACMLGLVYILRKAQGLVEAEELKYILDPMVPNANIGFAMGRTIPAIGVGTALLEATMIPLAVCAFAKHDLKGFKEYRRDVAKSHGGKWEPSLELERWGCNHAQVASVVLQTLGFGITRSNAFVAALSAKADSGTLEEVNLCRDFRMATIWRESIRDSFKAPTVPLPPKYYPTKAAQDNAVSKIKAVLDDSEASRWLLKGKDDLPAFQIPSTRELSARSATEQAGTADGDIDTLEEDLAKLVSETPE
jgi:hypothetical protein